MTEVGDEVNAQAKLLQILFEDVETHFKITSKIRKKSGGGKGGKKKAVSASSDPMAYRHQLLKSLSSCRGMHLDSIYKRFVELFPHEVRVLEQGDLDAGLGGSGDEEVGAWLLAEVGRAEEEGRIENLNHGLENVKPVFKLQSKTLSLLLTEREEKAFSAAGSSTLDAQLSAYARDSSSSVPSASGKAAGGGTLKFKKMLSGAGNVATGGAFKPNKQSALSGGASSAAQRLATASSAAEMAAKQRKLQMRLAASKKKKQHDKVKAARKGASLKRKMKKMKKLGKK